MKVTTQHNLNVYKDIEAIVEKVRFGEVKLELKIHADIIRGITITGIERRVYNTQKK